MPSGPNPQMFIPRKTWGDELDKAIKRLGKEGIPYEQALQDELANYLHIQERYNDHEHAGGAVTRSATVIVSASNSVNPADADFQADGTCDEVTINAAIASLPSTGGKVLLMEGTYNLCATIVADKAQLTIEGMGPSTFILTNGTYPAITTSASVPRIDNLHINTAGGSGGSNGGITFALGTTQALIMRLVLVGSTANSIRGISAINGSGHIITLCDISGFTRGIELAVGNSMVVNNQLSSNNDGVSCQPAATVSHILIGQNRISAGATTGIIVRRLANSLIIGNDVEGANSVGISVGGLEGLSVVGNRVNDTIGSGILLTASAGETTSNVLVTGNMSTNNTGANGYGIRLSASPTGATDDNFITANTCFGNAQYGVGVLNATCNTNVVVGNDLRFNTTGALNDLGTGTIILYPAGANGDNFP